jgi:hypothetical protein
VTVPLWLVVVCAASTLLSLVRGLVENPKGMAITGALALLIYLVVSVISSRREPEPAVDERPILLSRDTDPHAVVVYQGRLWIRGISGDLLPLDETPRQTHRPGR